MKIKTSVIRCSYGEHSNFFWGEVTWHDLVTWPWVIWVWNLRTCAEKAYKQVCQICEKTWWGGVQHSPPARQGSIIKSNLYRSACLPCNHARFSDWVGQCVGILTNTFGKVVSIIWWSNTSVSELKWCDNLSFYAQSHVSWPILITWRYGYIQYAMCNLPFHHGTNVQ